MSYEVRDNIRMFGPQRKVVRAQCNSCCKYELLIVPTDGWEAWHSGTLIQDAMPHLSKGDRELLISGTCEKCFELLFREGCCPECGTADGLHTADCLRQHMGAL